MTELEFASHGMGMQIARERIAAAKAVRRKRAKDGAIEPPARTILDPKSAAVAYAARTSFSFSYRARRMTLPLQRPRAPEVKVNAMTCS